MDWEEECFPLGLSIGWPNLADSLRKLVSNTFDAVAKKHPDPKVSPPTSMLLRATSKRVFTGNCWFLTTPGPRGVPLGLVFFGVARESRSILVLINKDASPSWVGPAKAAIGFTWLNDPIHGAERTARANNFPRYSSEVLQCLDWMGEVHYCLVDRPLDGFECAGKVFINLKRMEANTHPEERSLPFLHAP